MALSPQQRRELILSLPDQAQRVLAYDWAGVWARDSQVAPPGQWNTWLILAGRAFGKTRTAAETVRDYVESGRASRIALIAPTAADGRDTMVEGESGLLAVCPPWFKPKYEPSKRRVTWPNGARATLFSAEEPERLRGPQHDLGWGDEPASWPEDGMAWTNYQMGLRLGRDPRTILSGTPKPVRLILELAKDPKTVITRGSTYENQDNLAPEFIRQMKRVYEGTRLGQQEIHAQVLEDMPGALFSQALIDELRVAFAPELKRIIVSVDPAPTSDEGSDETGICVLGLGFDDHVYILEDLSCRASPDEWIGTVIKAFHTFKADCIVAEINNGGDMVETLLRTKDPNIPFKGLRAMRGKAKRAEPVAALYEQKKVHFVGSIKKFEKLERQMRVFTGVNGRRDDRVDAKNWGIHELALSAQEFIGFV